MTLRDRTATIEAVIVWTPETVLAKRRQLNMNQTEFWTHLNVTQAAGSRYEILGRSIPAWMHPLLTIAYGTEKQAEREVKRLRVTEPIKERERSLPQYPRRAA